MHDGKSLQAGTSHYLGQNFSKAFDIQFLDKDGTHKYGYTTSWGVSTRLIGALIMAHGDQRGLVIPPVVAPVQTILIPIAAKKEGVLEAVEKLRQELFAAGVRAESDTSDNSPGWKFNEWEMKGVPLRIELGPRDIEAGKMVLVRRDTHEKIETPIENAAQTVKALLADIQANLLEKARKRKEERVVTANSVEELLEGVEKGNFVKAGWCGCRECEDTIKEKTAASARVIVEGEHAEKCCCCGKEAKHVVLFARAY